MADPSEAHIDRAECAYWDALGLDDGENLGEGGEGAMREEQIARAWTREQELELQKVTDRDRENASGIADDVEEAKTREEIEHTLTLWARKLRFESIRYLAALPPASGDASIGERVIASRALREFKQGYERGRAEALEEAAIEARTMGLESDCKGNALAHKIAAAIRALARAPEHKP